MAIVENKTTGLTNNWQYQKEDKQQGWNPQFDLNYPEWASPDDAEDDGGGGGGGGGYYAPPRETAKQYINKIYDANDAAQRAALQAAYNQNVLALNRQSDAISPNYDAAANAAAAQSAINQRNFAEYAAGMGLNSGAGAQARLSQNNALLGNISSIRRAEADAKAEIEAKRMALEKEYQDAIAKAIADNNAQKAQLLYQAYLSGK